MKITMIGDSNVGKTTFMMTTYGMLRSGIEGFTVRCKNGTADKSLINAYRRFCNSGTYPDPTVKMNSYEYSFYSDGEWVMDFTLTDIRGESIHEDDVTKLNDNLKKSDAVMLFLNAYDIINGADIEDVITDLYMLLSNNVTTDNGLKMVMVIFTQCDRIHLTNQTFQQLVETVDELKRMADGNDDLVFEAVPTACSRDIMMDLDYAMANLMLIGYANDVLARRNLLNDEANRIGKTLDCGFWKKFKWTFWGDSELDNAQKRAKELVDVEIPEYEKMTERFERLRKFCDEYELGTFYSYKNRKDPFEL